MQCNAPRRKRFPFHKNVAKKVGTGNAKACGSQQRTAGVML